MSKKRTSSWSNPGEALVCPSCGRGHPADERFCQDCGMPLVRSDEGAGEPPMSAARERARKIHPELARGEPVRVARAQNQAEAELIQGILLEEGVPSYHRRSAGADVPDFLAAGPRDVLVPESGVQVAREALSAAAIEQSPPPQPSASLDRAVGIAAWLIGGGMVAALLVWLVTQA
jgi:hypothetical protein